MNANFNNLHDDDIEKKYGRGSKETKAQQRV